MGNIFNLGLFGHNKSGKTILGESMLFKSGAVTRLGQISEGNTILDYEEEEKKRLMSVNLSLGRLDWKSKKMYLIDTPGYMDFIGEQVCGLAAADFFVLNISAEAGIETGTEKIWSLLQELKLPGMVFINKMDLPEIDFSGLAKNLESYFGTKLVPITCPVFEGGKLSGVANLLDEKERGKEEYSEHSQRLKDSVAELDDTLMEKYLEEGILSGEELSGYLKKGITKGEIVPLLCGSAINQIGIDALLDFIIQYMPSSEDLPPVSGKDLNGNETTRKRNVDAPLSGIIFKTFFDPFVGRLSYLKVLSGKLSSNSVCFNSNKNNKERVGQLLRLQGKNQEMVDSALAGEVVAVAKLSESSTLDTFCDSGNPIIFDKILVPEGSLSYSIIPKVKGTEDKLGSAINKIVEEDFTVKVFRNVATEETIISGMGDVHLDVAISKFKDKFGVEVSKGIPKIAYKETITGIASAEGKYKRQTGGHGQYGHCWLKVEPLQKGEGFEFVDKVVGGSIPRQFIPSVEKGVIEAMQRGVLADYPMVDMRVTLYDGSFHTVDSSDRAFQIAGSMGLQKATAEANIILLEPIVNIEVRVPQDFVGDIMGSINSKRGKVSDMLSAGAYQIVKAKVPLAEMSNYNSEIRSITSGKGSYSMEFSHYEEVPHHIAEKIVQEKQEKKEEKS